VALGTMDFYGVGFYGILESSQSVGEGKGVRASTVGPFTL